MKVHFVDSGNHLKKTWCETVGGCLVVVIG
uniref:Uncharacterized protein n=1 Tax=Rhizophora mucronata TaxID=61149 RepID=A0A2P2PPX2_RHIMU